MSGIVPFIDKSTFFTEALAFIAIVNAILIFYWFSTKQSAWVGAVHVGVSLIAAVILF